jgi:hypothetical protein
MTRAAARPTPSTRIMARLRSSRAALQIIYRRSAAASWTVATGIVLRRRGV